MDAAGHANAAYRLLVAAPEGNDETLRQAGLHYRQAAKLAKAACEGIEYYQYEALVNRIRYWCCTPAEKSQEVRHLLWLAKPFA